MAAKKIKMRAKIKNGVAQVKTLMPHPMETGVRKSEDGAVIPAHYIQKVTCEHNGQVVVEAEWGASVSRDPYFAFKVNDAVPGDIIKVSWVDNLGESSSGEITLK
jgi:thiosulfate oxidation carrier complex protein SoxZ